MNNFATNLLNGAKLANAAKTLPEGMGGFTDADGVNAMLELNAARNAKSIPLNLRGEDKAAVNGASLYAVMPVISTDDLLAVIPAETLTNMLAHYVEAFSRDIAKEAVRDAIAAGEDWKSIQFQLPTAERIVEMLTDEFSDARSSSSVANLSEEDVNALYTANFAQAVTELAKAKGAQDAQLPQVHSAYRQLLRILFSRSAKTKVVGKLQEAVGRFIEVMPASEALQLVKARMSDVKAKQDKEAAKNPLAGFFI